MQSYDRNLSEVKSLRLQLSADDDEPFLLASISLLSSGLELIWQNRKSKKSVHHESRAAGIFNLYQKKVQTEKGQEIL